MPELDDVATPETPRRRRHRWVWPAALVLLLLLALGLGGVWVWDASTQRGLGATVEELRRAGEPVAPADLNEPPVSDAVNAATDLRAAAESIDHSTQQWNDFGMLALRLPLSDAELAQVDGAVGANAAALELVGAATRKRAVWWGRVYQSPMLAQVMSTQALNEYGKRRRLAQLLQGAALGAHQHGDDAAALRHVRELLFLARAARQEPTLIEYLVALGIESTGDGAAADVAPDLRVGPAGGPKAAPREQVLALIKELLDDAEPKAGLRRALQGERVFGLDALTGPGAPGSTGARGFVARPVLRRNAEHLLRAMTDVIRCAGNAPDWPTFQQQLAGTAPSAGPNSPYAVLARVQMPSILPAVKAHYRTLAHRRLGATALAARLYALDHDGRLPATLQYLVPAYLPAVPLDPLAAGKPLGYVADADRPRIYSVGENGTDEGGNDAEPTTLPAGAVSRHPADEVRYLKRQPRPATAPAGEEPTPTRG